MYIGRIIGKAVSTIKDARLQGLSLVLVRRITASGEAAGEVLAAADVIGCGPGNTVLLASGKAARLAVSRADAPLDLAVVGIVDDFDCAGTPEGSV